MKKTIKSLLAIAVAALTFHSCADVPAPYQIPDSGGSGGNLPEGVIFKQVFSSDKGDFIIKNLSLAEGLSGSDIWTTGASYIKATTYLQLSGETAKKNHNADSWLISPKVSLKDMTTAYVILNHSTGYLNGAKPATCLKVMVSDNYTDGAAINVDDWKDIEIDNWYTGTSFEFVNGNGDLKDFIGKENVHVALRYIGTESTSPTWEISSLTIADTPVKPEEKEMPKDLTGKGTPEDPYTVADAHKIIDVFGSSESPEVYVKGKVVSREFSSQHSSMTYFISDTGSEDNKLEVYGGKYFNKQGFTSESQLNVGDVVIVVGKLVNYQGKTREFTNGNYIYMLNGQTSGGEVDPQPQPVDPTGENLLANGDFELWTSGLPDNWKSTTTASNATLTQSTDTHSGSYAVKIAHDAAANKRMAYKEITLKAGTYLLAFYVKGSDGTASVRPGYTNILENGKANSTYTYGDYVNDIPQNEWKLVNHTFTLASETKLNLVIMVPKNSASDPLVDDVTLTTSDGGMADGGQTEPVDPVDPQPTGSSYLNESFANGQGAFTIEDKTQLTGIWTAGSYGSDKYMQATSFLQLTGETKKTNHDAESWLISPEIDLSNASAPLLTFNQVINKYFGTIADEAMVYLQKNGGTWTKLPMTYPAKPSSTFSKFTDNGAAVSINLSEYKGSKIRIAFVYIGKSATAGTWEVKDVKVAEAAQ